MKTSGNNSTPSKGGSIMQKNKSGKGNPMLYVFGTILVLAVVFMAFNSYKQSTDGGSASTQASSCAIDTTFAPTVGDALNPSSTVSANVNAQINGGKNQTILSTTKLQRGNSLDILLTATNYEAKIINGVKINSCGANTESYEMKYISAPTVKILTSPSNAIVTNSSLGGSQNLTTVAGGGALSFNIELIGTDKKTTGNMVVLVEMNSSVSSMTLGGNLGIVKKPSTYSTRVSTNSQVFYFTLPAFDNAKDVIHNVVASMKSGESYSGVVYVSVLGEDSFLDSTGEYSTGIETSDGQTRKSAYDRLAVGVIA